MSTLTYAILAELARGPATGYVIAAAMRSPVGRYWTAQHSQIYPELARLAERGWAGVAESDGPGPRPTKTYTITPDWLAALRAWARTPEPPPPPNSPTTVKLSCAWLLNDDELAGLLDGLRAEAAAGVARFEGLLAGLDSEPPRDDPTFAAALTVPIGLGYERHRLEWAEWALAEVARRRR